MKRISTFVLAGIILLTGVTTHLYAHNETVKTQNKEDRL